MIGAKPREIAAGFITAAGSTWGDPTSSCPESTQFDCAQRATNRRNSASAWRRVVGVKGRLIQLPQEGKLMAFDAPPVSVAATRRTAPCASDREMKLRRSIFFRVMDAVFIRRSQVGIKVVKLTTSDALLAAFDGMSRRYARRLRISVEQDPRTRIRVRASLSFALRRAASAVAITADGQTGVPAAVCPAQMPNATRAATSFSYKPASDSEITWVFASTGMKLESPGQRGTMCRCR